MLTERAPVSAQRRWADLGRGLAAMAAMAALVAGVPWALSSFVGWPLPTSVPSWSDITVALGDSYIPDTFLAKALAVVCWVVWVELVASLLVEAVAVVRGRQARSVPLAGPVQPVVARMVAAVSLMVVLVLTRPDGAGVQAVRPVVPATAAGFVPAAPARSTGTPEAAVVEQVLPTYQVQRRDTLWGIAETHLHDPFRWVEIWELNRDLPQPDGRAMTDPDRICPGWVVRLPAGAVGLGSPAGPPAAPVSSPGGGSEAMTLLAPGEGAAGSGTVLAPSGIVSGEAEAMVPLEPGTVLRPGQEPELASEGAPGGVGKQAAGLEGPQDRRR